MEAEMAKYIHYGCKSFEKGLFTSVVNAMLSTKPMGGLWASRIDAAYGWKEWCNSSDFRDCTEENSFTFSLSNNARVLYTNSVNDLEDLPELHNEFGICSWKLLDFEELAKTYDAIEVNISSDPELYFALYGWDCDSILIMNPNIIE